MSNLRAIDIDTLPETFTLSLSDVLVAETEIGTRGVIIQVLSNAIIAAFYATPTPSAPPTTPPATTHITTPGPTTPAPTGPTPTTTAPPETTTPAPTTTTPPPTTPHIVSIDISGSSSVTAGLNGGSWSYSVSDTLGLVQVRFSIDGHSNGIWTPASGTTYSSSASWAGPTIGSPDIFKSPGNYTFRFEAQDSLGNIHSDTQGVAVGYKSLTFSASLGALVGTTQTVNIEVGDALENIHYINQVDVYKNLGSAGLSFVASYPYDIDMNTVTFNGGLGVNVYSGGDSIDVTLSAGAGDYNIYPRTSSWTSGYHSLIGSVFPLEVTI